MFLLYVVIIYRQYIYDLKMIKPQYRLISKSEWLVVAVVVLYIYIYMYILFLDKVLCGASDSFGVYNLVLCWQITIDQLPEQPHLWENEG